MDDTQRNVNHEKEKPSEGAREWRRSFGCPISPSPRREGSSLELRGARIPARWLVSTSWTARIYEMDGWMRFCEEPAPLAASPHPLLRLSRAGGLAGMHTRTARGHSCARLIERRVARGNCDSHIWPRAVAERLQHRLSLARSRLDEAYDSQVIKAHRVSPRGGSNEVLRSSVANGRSQTSHDYIILADYSAHKAPTHARHARPDRS